jgi:hypothetical protein
MEAIEERNRKHKEQMQKRLERRKKSQKLMQRTSRGQPVMKNMLEHLMEKLKWIP